MRLQFFFYEEHFERFPQKLGNPGLETRAARMASNTRYHYATDTGRHFSEFLFLSIYVL